MAKSRLMNFRVPEWLDEMVARAVTLSGAKDTSAFARDALEAASRREIAEHERREEQAPAPPPPGSLGGGFRNSQRCVHPATARRNERPDAEYCGLCNTVTRIKM